MRRAVIAILAGCVLVTVFAPRVGFALFACWIVATGSMLYFKPRKLDAKERYRLALEKTNGHYGAK